MPHPTLSRICLLLPFAVAACDGDGGFLPIGPNPSPTPETRVPRDLDPTTGGGTAGEDLDGVLTVFVLDATDAPLASAEVRVGGLSAQTDENGRADLYGEGLRGRQDVHVFAEGFAFHSTLDLEASVLTASLQALTAPTGERRQLGVADVSGAVEGWHRLPAPSGGLARVVQVEAFGRGELTRPEQPARPGSATIDDPDGVPMNIAVDGAPPYATWRDFGVRLDTGAQGLVAFGSTFDPERSPVLVDSFLGFTLGLDLTDGDAVDGLDVRLSHPLDTSLEIAGPVSELPVRMASFGVDLGDGLVLPLGGGPLSGLHNRFAKAPSLVEEFAEARYVFALHLFSREKVGARPAVEVRSALHGVRADMNMQDTLQPPPPPALAGRTLEAIGSDDAELGRVQILDASGRLRWQIWRLDPQAPARALPNAPEGWDDGLTEGRVEIESSAFDVGPVSPERWDFVSLEPVSEAHHRVEIDR